MTYEEKSHVKSNTSKVLIAGDYYDVPSDAWKSQSASDVAKILERSETESKIQFVLFWVPVALFCAGVGLYIWRHT